MAVVLHWEWWMPSRKTNGAEQAYCELGATATRKVLDSSTDLIREGVRLGIHER